MDPSWNRIIVDGLQLGHFISGAQTPSRLAGDGEMASFNRKKYSNHPFSGAMLVSGSVTIIFLEKPLALPKSPSHTLGL